MFTKKKQESIEMKNASAEIIKKCKTEIVVNSTKYSAVIVS